MQVSKQAAARFLLQRQGLLAGTPGRLWREKLTGTEGAFQAIERLECVQVDPVNVLERNQHLVLAARVGAYTPSQLEALFPQGKLLDYICNARSFLPMHDWPLLKPLTERFHKTLQSEVQRLGEHYEEVYRLLSKDGPLSSRQIELDATIRGWWDQSPKTKISSMALEILWHMGRVGIAKRTDNERFYDVIDRVIPPEVQAARTRIGMEEATAQLLCKYMKAHRLFYPGHFRFGWLHQTAAEKKQYLTNMARQGSVVAVEVEGVARKYWVLAEDAEDLQAAAKWDVEPIATLLPPLDNLLWLRERLVDFFNFDYKWEIYTPKEKRRYGNYTLPLLIGDRFVGRVDAHLRRDAGVMVLDAFYPEEWLMQMPVRSRKSYLAPAKQALRLLADACLADEVTIAPDTTDITAWLWPTAKA